MTTLTQPLLSPNRQSLLLVDDDPASIEVLGQMLAPLGDVRFALSGTQGLELAREQAPDVMLVDAEMPGMSGFDLCSALQRDPRLKDVPVIMITGHVEVSYEVAGFAAGVADFIRKPPVAEVVLARVKTQLRLKAMTDALRESALTDGLTGLANRRSFDRNLQAEISRVRRSQGWLGVLMIDIDHFKRLNDRYGHLVGDDSLRQVARAIQAAVRRPPDLASRYGGEEFAVLLPQTEPDGAEDVARRIVSGVAALQLPNEDSPLGQIVTVSVGGSALRADQVLTGDDGRSGRHLVEAADRALYAAKSAGRHQVSFQVVMPPSGEHA